MGSKRILLSSVDGEILGQASQSYLRSEKYEWKNLILNQSDQATRDQPDHVATLHLPPDMPGRLGPSHGHGRSSEISGDGVGGCHGEYHAGHNHSLERARHSISREPGPIRSYRIKKSPSFDHVPHCAKGHDKQIHPAGSCKKNYSANQGSGSQNRQYHVDRYPPTQFDDHFSEIDAERHRSYLSIFQSSSKHIPVQPSHDQSSQRDEVAKAQPKRTANGFRPIHQEQLELSPNDSSRNLRNAYNGKVTKRKFQKCFDSSRNLRNVYNGKVAKKKFKKQDFLGNTYNGACASKYNRNSSRKRNADHLGGKKARKNDTNKDKSKRLRCSIQQDQRQKVESDKMRNDSREGNVETTKLMCQDEPKGNFDPKKNAPASSSSTKCDGKNMLSPKCSKTIASSQAPNLSEGSKDMDLESDNDVDGCTERGILQHIPVAHTERNIQLEISENVSQSEALRRDCVILWRKRQLRKDRAAQRSKMSTGRRVMSGGPAASSSSESDNKDATASECSNQFSSATSSDELQKCGEGRAKKKLEQTIKFRSNSKSNKRPQNTTAGKGLKCSVKLLPEANPLATAQPKEKPADHPDAKVHSSLNGCSDTCKVDQSSVLHCDNSTHQNISQQGINKADLEGREEKPGVKCEKKAGDHGAKLAEQSTGLYTDPILLDRETVASCVLHGNSKVNAPRVPDHEIGSTSLDGPMLSRGTANMCQKKSINRSSESYCIDFENCLDGNVSRDNQQQTACDNVLRMKQECSLLAETEVKLNAKARKEDCLPFKKRRKEDCQPQARRVEIASNQRITTEDCASDTIHSGAAKQDDRILRPLIPDLNCSPSMISDEDFMAPPEEPVCQGSAESFKPQSISMNLSDSLTGPTSKGEQCKQVEEKRCNQAEATNQITKEVCKDGTSEAATQLQISESNTGSRQVSAVEESSTSMNALKFALCEFVKSFLKPLWDDGLLSREVHKIVVKKAVDKVADAWAHSTEINIPRILSDEAGNIRNLVKGYLEMYVGREVLKNRIPRSS